MACTYVGWPAPRATYLRRARTDGIWEAHPPEPPPPRPPRPGDPEEAETPEDVATADPVAGLLQMGVSVDATRTPCACVTLRCCMRAAHSVSDCGVRALMVHGALLPVDVCQRVWMANGSLLYPS
eukprot:78796-Chlamydomonas_euryale.AAC.2